MHRNSPRCRGPRARDRPAFEGPRRDERRARLPCPAEPAGPLARGVLIACTECSCEPGNRANGACGIRHHCRALLGSAGGAARPPTGDPPDGAGMGNRLRFSRAGAFARGAGRVRDVRQQPGVPHRRRDGGRLGEAARPAAEAHAGAVEVLRSRHVEGRARPAQRGGGGGGCAVGAPRPAAARADDGTFTHPCPARPLGPHSARAQPARSDATPHPPRRSSLARSSPLAPTCSPRRTSRSW